MQSMGAEFSKDWRESLASALEWWRDAGVDTLTEANARDWLAAPAPVRAPLAPAAAVALPPAETLPDTLDAFLAWRLGKAAPEADWHAPLVPPTGSAGADLMAIVDMPEPDDSSAGTLLNGAPGRLFDRMLAAIGLSRDSIYLASLAVARPVTGQVPADRIARLAELARHHVGLVAPKRVLLLGQSTERALLSTDRSGDGNSLGAINHFGGQTKAVASFHPRLLLDRPAAKPEAWKHLLSLTGGAGL